ncbi:MAG: hypothetical protein KA521_07030 [Crocinitomicaceae bacterium]|nr:hypothetical protein [Crocinitomicaceae bacterium]
MKLLFLLLIVFAVFSCKNKQDTNQSRLETEQRALGKNALKQSNHKEKYVSKSTEKAVLESKIKEKYGQQYTFCDCIQKGDSLNKALKNNKLSDKELDRLIIRFDEIDKKCQSFRLNDANATPRERQKYKKKVKACLQ